MKEQQNWLQCPLQLIEGNAALCRNSLEELTSCQNHVRSISKSSDRDIRFTAEWNRISARRRPELKDDKGRRVGFGNDQWASSETTNRFYILCSVSCDDNRCHVWDASRRPNRKTSVFGKFFPSTSDIWAVENSCCFKLLVFYWVFFNPSTFLHQSWTLWARFPSADRHSVRPFSQEIVPQSYVRCKKWGFGKWSGNEREVSVA